MSTPVKYFLSTMRGAPVLSGTVGSLIAVLDACLVTGFGSVSALSVNVSGGVATATLPSGQAFEVGAVLQVSGATPSALNGEVRCTAASLTSVSWATSAPDGAASGSISIRYAPAGWTKLHSGTNKAAYVSASPESSGCCLRVDDTGTTSARVRGFESMSDVETGVGPFPTDAQMSGGGYWPKSIQANATAVPWEVFADARGFHYVSAFQQPASPTYQGRSGWYFGDFPSRKSGDAWACALLSGATAADPNSSHLRRMNSSNQLIAARSYSGIGGAARCGRSSPVLSNGTSALEDTRSGAEQFCGDYPNSVDNALITAPVLILEGAHNTTQVWRGTLPGILHAPQRISATAFSPNDAVTATDHLAGRRLLASPFTANGQSITGTFGMVFYDATGPWR